MWYTRVGIINEWIPITLFSLFFAHNFFEIIDVGMTFKPIMKSTLTQVKAPLELEPTTWYDNSMYNKWPTLCF